nr:SpoIIE family protein phosphatase [candidate division Zixibacteria bacterium]
MTLPISTEDEIFDLESKLEKTRLKLLDLTTMGALITSILNLETILSVVMEMSIRTVDGEVGLIQLEENGELVSKITWGVDDTVIRNIIYRDDKNVADYCFIRQEPVVMSDFGHNTDLGPNLTSLLALPIKSRSQCHGVIVIINKTTDELFTDEDQKNLEMLINFAAVAIDNSILLKESLQKQKIEQELTIARQIQETILPNSAIKIKGVDIGRLYRPARSVGGDFYDIVKLSDSEFVIIVGDVSNKGIPAAMLMAASIAIIRCELMKCPDISPGTLMNNLNNVLCSRIIKSHDMFVTMFIAHINLDSREIVYCNAGHLPPLFWDSGRREISEWRPGGTFVGQFPDMQFKEDTMVFNPGDRFLAFTDGITEAEDINGRQFGTERLKRMFLREIDMSAEKFCSHVRDQVDRFTEGAGEEPFDDLTLLAIRMLRDDQK